LRGIASKTGLDFFEIVGPFWMRSVISDAHVVGNDGLKFIPPPAGGGTLRGFSLRGEFFDTLMRLPRSFRGRRSFHVGQVNRFVTPLARAYRVMSLK